MAEYRHEYKYIIDGWNQNILLSRIEKVLERDQHSSSVGTYIVRSLYFDDYMCSLYNENLDGVDERSKYRIRYYGLNAEYMKLEKKSKYRGMTKKESCTLSISEAKELISGLKTISNGNDIKSKLLNEMLMKKMLPATIVTYERIPFVYKTGNVRVTFDTNITSSTDFENFLTGDYRQRPILSLGSSILEVKWDEVLPLHIKEILEIGNLDWSGFSKYSSCFCYNF